MSTYQPAMESTRREDRVRAYLMIKVFFKADDEYPALASTYEVSRYGARIGRIPGIDRADQCIWVQRHDRTAKYRVAWIGAPGSTFADQVGLELVDRDTMIWEDELSRQLR